MAEVPDFLRDSFVADCNSCVAFFRANRHFPKNRTWFTVDGAPGWPLLAGCFAVRNELITRPAMRHEVHRFVWMRLEVFA